MATFEASIVPEEHREHVASALRSAFGPQGVSSMAAVTGGASGALTYRVETGDGPHLLRIEGIRGPLRNPHQYECMQIAADAGIAPPIRHLDADAGVLVMPFISQQPLASFAGGPPALATAAAELLARLHHTTPFPVHGDHLDNLDRMLRFLERSGRVAPGLLDRHIAAFEHIRAVYPWQPETFVSAHNDPNELNLLFDGDRLWLIDWETASRNDPFVDVATVGHHLGTTPDLREQLLSAWLGRGPDALDRARLTLMSRITQLYAGSIILIVVVDPEVPTHTDLTPMTIDQFRAAVASGELQPSTPAIAHAFAKLVLGQYIEGLAAPELEHALRVAASG